MTTLLWIVAFYAVMSLITFAAYGIDKRRATRDKRRISERTLHLLELAGGWPGALAGQTLFRHKRRKPSYMVLFIGIILLHAAAWYLCWRMNWLP